MRDALDRFYTPNTSVEQCLSYIDVAAYDVVVEPSAGSGAFSSRIPGVVAYDIAPEHPDVIKKNWFEVLELPPGEKVLIVGNPPFGKRSSIAKEFITHAIRLGADTIAFVLPDTFYKFSNQRMFPEHWRLVETVKLDDTHFDMLDGSTIHIPCSFFVWTRLADYKPDVNLREEPAPQTPEFRFLKRGDTSADFAVNGNSGKVRDIQDITNSKAEHYIKVNDGYDVATIRAVFKKIDYTFLSSVNGGVAWLNQDDLRRAFVKSQQQS